MKKIRIIIISSLLLSSLSYAGIEECPQFNGPFVKRIYSTNELVGCLNKNYYKAGDIKYQCTYEGINVTITKHVSKYCRWSSDAYVSYDKYTLVQVNSCPAGQVPDSNNVCATPECPDDQFLDKERNSCQDIPRCENGTWDGIHSFMSSEEACTCPAGYSENLFNNCVPDAAAGSKPKNPPIDGFGIESLSNPGWAANGATDRKYTGTTSASGQTVDPNLVNKLKMQSAGFMLDEYPLNINSRMLDTGGDKSPLDSYQDGVGLFIDGVPTKEDLNIDNSPMNDLVFKYGEKIKEVDTETPSIKLMDYVTAPESGSDIKDASKAQSLEGFREKFLQFHP